MKLKNAFIAFYICLPLVIVLRFIYLRFMIDPKTGFTQTDSPLGGIWSTAIVSVMFFGLVLVLYILSRISGSWPTAITSNNRVLGVIAIVLGVCNGYEIIRIFSSYDETGKLAIWLLLLFSALLSSVFYLCYGLGSFIGFRLPPVCSLLPVAFHVLLLITTFMKYTALANVGENSYDIACLCLILVFSLEFAKLTCSYDFFKTSRNIYGVGLSAALMCVVITIPRYIILVMGYGDSLHTTLTLSPYFLVYAVFILVFLGLNMRQLFSSEEIAVLK